MKNWLIALLCSTPAIVFGQTEKYTIKGSIGTLDAPATVFLVYNNAIAGKAVLNHGAFTMSGTVDGPTQAYLMVNPKGNSSPTNNYTVLYLEAGGTIKVASTNDLTEASITGTKNNDARARYKTMMRPLENRDRDLEVKDTTASEEQKRSPKFLKALELANMLLEKEKNAANKKFITENPSSLVSLEALYYYAMYNDYAAVAPLYRSLSAAVKNSPGGKSYAETLKQMEHVGVGSIAPDFTMPDTANRLIKLSSFRGKYVLLDFWASWCPICREAAPGVVKAYGSYKSKNFNILSVSLDKPGDRQKWLHAIRHDGLKWTQVSDLSFWKSPVVGLYKLTALPQNFLIDPTGKIIARDLDSDQLAARLVSIFGVKN
ncbi:MAG TPA: TlpA disulfide reductase family protein [Mucilaginibacter sp.]|jgi:peroxiredoxin|nr:TlpA disulfide reductase family protein [Mucilaginibacter sp.]